MSVDLQVPTEVFRLCHEGVDSGVVADGSHMEVRGSLGGVQVVSLCEGKGVHTRIVSAGRAAAPHAHAHALSHDDDKALLFTVTRNVETLDDADAPGNLESCSVHLLFARQSLWVRNACRTQLNE